MSKINNYDYTYWGAFVWRSGCYCFQLWELLWWAKPKTLSWTGILIYSTFWHLETVEKVGQTATENITKIITSNYVSLLYIRAAVNFEIIFFRSVCVYACVLYGTLRGHTICPFVHAAKVFCAKDNSGNVPGSTLKQSDYDVAAAGVCVGRKAS